MKKIVQKYNYQIWAFLIAVIPRMILSLFAYPIRTMSDELGTISNGAFWLDWIGLRLLQKVDITVQDYLCFLHLLYGI